MADPLTNLTGSPPPPPPLQKSPFSSFHYGAIAMASIAILLLTYNFIVIRWCWRNHRARRSSDPYHGRMISSSSTRMLLPLSKYRKDEADTQASDTECSVCLSVFADGEDVRQLPQCKHSFHADCIDMWLFSHSDCPLCRTKLAVGPRHCPAENSPAAVG